jgi:hypothetical protein
MKLKFILIVILLTFIYCKKTNETIPDIPDPVNSVSIDYFKANKSVIPAYEPTILSWSVQNASTVVLSGVGVVAPTGSQNINIQETTLFNLYAMGFDNRSITKWVTVTVDKSNACTDLAIVGITAIDHGMKIEVGPNHNKYYSANNVTVEVKLYDNKNKIIDSGIGIIDEIKPLKNSTITIFLDKAGRQYRSECNIIHCVCDYKRP